MMKNIKQPIIRLTLPGNIKVLKEAGGGCLRRCTDSAQPNHAPFVNVATAPA